MAEQPLGRRRGNLDFTKIHVGGEGGGVLQAQHAVKGKRIEILRDGGLEHLRDVGLEDVAGQNIFHGAGDGRFILGFGEIRLPAADGV